MESKKTNKKPLELMDTENRLMVARDGRVGKMGKVVKRYKLAVIRETTPGDVMYIVMTIVKNTVFFFFLNIFIEV